MEFYGKPASYSFRKVMYVPINNSELFRKIHFNSSNFQLWSQIWNEILKFLCCNFNHKIQLITFPKRYLASKSIHGDRRYLQLNIKKCAKFAEIGKQTLQLKYEFSIYSKINLNSRKMVWVSFPIEYKKAYPEHYLNSNTLFLPQSFFSINDILSFSTTASKVTSKIFIKC